MSYTRVISSDSHVNVRHDDVKAHLASKFHGDYDAALMEYAHTVFGGNAAKANQAGAEIKHASWGRPGHFDPQARLADMDTDGVDVEVLYCEVSAYRYLYLLENGAHGDTRVQRHVPRLRVRRSVAPRRHLPGARSTTSTWPSRRCSGSPTMGGKSLSCRCSRRARRARLLRRALRPALRRHQRDRAPGVLPHRAQHRARPARGARSTPRLAVLTLSCTPPTACEALGIWLLTGILVRFPELEVVFVEPGLGWVAWYLTFLDDMVLRQGYEFPVLQGELPSFYYHRNMAMTFIDEPDSVRHLPARSRRREPDVVERLPTPVSTWPKSLAVIDEQLGDLPRRDRDLMVWQNAARVWSLVRCT